MSATLVAAGPGHVSGLELLHRRLALGMGLAGVLAFGAGVGWGARTAVGAGVVLLVALFFRTSRRASAQLEHLWLIIALVLIARALYYGVVVGGDIVLPVVDVLLFLMCAEAVRSLDALNDVRLYGLSFALLLAATAYRPGVAFAVAFLAYFALASPALTLGHLRRKLAVHRVRDEGLGGSLLPTALALSGAALLTGILVFLLFPRTSQVWAGRGSHRGASVAGFSDVVSIGEFGATIQSNPEVVLRIEFPDVLPAEMEQLYWRGRSYDRFDGVRWRRSNPIRPSAMSLSRWPGPTVTQKIYGSHTESRVLFALHPLVDVEPESAIDPMADNVGDFLYWGSSTPVYTARSLLGRPTPTELRASTGSYAPDQNYYLQLPPLAPRVGALADSLTQGLESRYDKVARIESWLSSEFEYALLLPRTEEEATLEHFLFERRAGHCEYFSTAMVVMLRSLGIEARNVNGFLGGTWSELGSYLAVTQNDAHSWVEVWFPTYGWVSFDPTPAGSEGLRSASSWFWPGRFFLDAVQHRWGKWVLDYSIQDQSNVLGEALSAFRSDGRRGDAGATRWLDLLPLVALGGTVALALALVLARRSSAARYETRVYLQLLESCRRAGVVRGQVAPLELVERLRVWGGVAVSTPAGSLIALYLRARFAGQALADDERAEMGRALRGARRALARRGGERSVRSE